MLKVFTLLLIALLAIGSISGYFIINKMILAGNVKIAEGKKQLAAGEKKLAKGKARLARGEKQLSQGKQLHGSVQNVPVTGVLATLPVGWAVLAVAGSQVVGGKVSEGERQVAAGKEKIKAGKKRIKAGKLQLRHGIERIDLAKKIRTALAIGSIVFTLLLLVLGLYWWRMRLTKQK